jgi:hypothetical protein
VLTLPTHCARLSSRTASELRCAVNPLRSWAASLSLSVASRGGACACGADTWAGHHAGDDPEEGLIKDIELPVADITVGDDAVGGGQAQDRSGEDEKNTEEVEEEVEEKAEEVEKVEEDERFEERRHTFEDGHMVHSYVPSNASLHEDEDAITPYPAAPPAPPGRPSPPLPVYTSQQAANAMKNPLIQIHRSTALQGDEVRARSRCAQSPR